jgi:hypothetical protein
MHCIAKEPANDLLLKKARSMRGLTDTFVSERGFKTAIKAMTQLLDKMAAASKKCASELLKLVEVEKMNAVQICNFVTEGPEAAQLFALYMDWKSMTPIKDKLIIKMNLSKDVLSDYSAKESVIMAAVKLEVVHCSLLAATLRPLTGDESRKKLVSNAKKGIMDGMVINPKISALASQVGQDLD